MGWNDWLTIFNTVDTFLGLFVLILATERIVVWYNRLRKWRNGEGDSHERDED